MIQTALPVASPLGGAPPVPNLPIDPIVSPPNEQYLVNIGVTVLPQAEVAALELMTEMERAVIIMSSLRVLIGRGGAGPSAGPTGPDRSKAPSKAEQIRRFD
ncbi:hypothetical protein PtB15_14B294 [Puccinia triticina]|nr:hypothetical protein PtB15_14B294 [Puccinia triticina]